MAQQTTRYKVRVKNIDFTIPTRYSSLSYLGGGSYGLVASAKDAQRANKDNGMIAIKRIGGVFRDIIDAKRILREMKLLRHLRGHANVVGIHNIFSGPTNSKGLSKVKFNDIYLVTPLFQSDLFKIIQSDQKLSPAHARYFMYQLLRGLKYIHSANIIHRDLKPANLLINSDCQLAICDFGLARGIPNLNDSFRQVSTHKNQNSTVQLTHYVVTRWYRAPELLVENNEYGKAIDMWSVGCILGEILGRRVLFRGSDYLDQLKKVINVIGTPSESDCYFVQNMDCKRAMARWSRKRRQPWSSIYPNAEKPALDLLDKLLTWDPERRITVDQAMRHPYIQEYIQPEREPICPASFNFDFEQHHDIKQPSKIRELMRQEMSLYPITESSSSTTTSTSTTTTTTSTSTSPSTKKKAKEDRSKRSRGTPTSRGSGVGSSDKKRPNNRRTSPQSPSSPSSAAAFLSHSSSFSSNKRPTHQQNAYPPQAPQANNHRGGTAGLSTSRLVAETKQVVGQEMNSVLSSMVPTMVKSISNQVNASTLQSINAATASITSTLLKEMHAIEHRMTARIESRIEHVVDGIITRRLNEFEKRLEAGEEEEGDTMLSLSQSALSMSLDHSGGSSGRSPESNILNRKV